MRRTRISLALAAGALGLAGLAGYGIASADTGHAATLVSQATAGAGQEPLADGDLNVRTVADTAERRALLQRFGARSKVMHGEVTVRTEKQGDKVVAVQRGTVKSYTGNALTVASPDGFTQTWTVADDARVIKNREKADTSAITNGATVIVAGAKSGDQHPARLVVIPKA